MSAQTAVAVKTPPGPPKEIRIQDIILLTARLAQILAEEADFLTEMKLDKVDALQKEKLLITAALEQRRKLIEKQPQLLNMSANDKAELKRVVDVFNRVLAENHRKLLLAKEINGTIVRAITDVVKEQTQRKVYNGRGATGAAPYETLSVTLNKQV